MARKIRVRRRGYWRGPYVYRRRGKLIRVKRHYVGPTTYTRKDVGKPGKGPKLIEVEPGKLKKYGYSTSKNAAARHRALRKAVKAYGAGKVWHMLHAQVIYRKRTQPKARRIFEADRDWVARHYGGPTPKAAIRAWKRMSPRERARRMPGGKI